MVTLFSLSLSFLQFSVLALSRKPHSAILKLATWHFPFLASPPPERQRRKKKTLPQHHYRISIEFTKEKKEYIDVDVCKRKSAYII